MAYIYFWVVFTKGVHSLKSIHIQGKCFKLFQFVVNVLLIIKIWKIHSKYSQIGSQVFGLFMYTVLLKNFIQHN